MSPQFVFTCVNPHVSPHTPLNGHMIKVYAIFLKLIFFLGHPVILNIIYELYQHLGSLRQLWKARVLHCTIVDGATIAPGREVTEDGSRYGSASSRSVKFTPADIFEGHTKI